MSFRTRISQSSSLYLRAKERVLRRGFARVYDVQIRSGNATPADRLQRQGEADTVNMTQRNVLRTPLTLHSTRPLTGFLRTGYCESSSSDAGNHSIAAIVSNEFLDFSASRGNDLRSVGLTDGCKWCLCVSRWKEAFDARKNDGDKLVPKVVLSATNERALEGVRLEDLRKFGVDGKERNGSG